MNLRRPVFPVLVAIAVLSGCSDEAPVEAPPKADETPTAIPAQPTAPAEPEVTLERPKLPDDVFFDDPLAIAANRTRIPGAPSASETPAMTASPGSAPTSPATNDTAATKSVDWEELLPADLLAVEVTRIRERFEPKLMSVATFNNSLLDFPPYAAELAALAGIATEHPGRIPWKENAKFVRDLAGEMLSDQLQRGQKSYDQINGPFAKIVGLLDGKRPEELPEAEDATDFSMTADFGYLMRRLEAGQHAMKTIGSSEQAFKANAADLAREARVLAALSAVFARADYGYGDDTKFQEYASAMTQSALTAATAAESGDFKAFDDAQNAMGQSCVQCHGEYRNN